MREIFAFTFILGSIMSNAISTGAFGLYITRVQEPYVVSSDMGCGSEKFRPPSLEVLHAMSDYRYPLPWECS
jgi:hypothetical protein